MYKLNIKAISLNEAYRGRRFKTKELESFKELMMWKLPKDFTIDPSKPMLVKYEFGVSTDNIDGDNLIKCTQDALATRYGFNDNKIQEWQVKKVKVPKGQEYISFYIENI